jgi:hypothetical protein
MYRITLFPATKSNFPPPEIVESLHPVLIISISDTGHKFVAQSFRILIYYSSPRHPLSQGVPFCGRASRVATFEQFRKRLLVSFPVIHGFVTSMDLQNYLIAGYFLGAIMTTAEEAQVSSLHLLNSESVPNLVQ